MCTRVYPDLKSTPFTVTLQVEAKVELTEHRLINEINYANLYCNPSIHKDTTMCTGLSQDL